MEFTEAALGWTELGVGVGLLALAFGIYRFKANNQDSSKEREEYLRRLEGKSMKKDVFAITVDNVEFEERSGLLYRLKRVLLRPVKGTTYVTVRLHEIGVPEAFWEMEHAEVFYEELDIQAECVNTQVESKFTALVFEVHTAEFVELKTFLNDFLVFLRALDETDTISIEWIRGKPPNL